VLNNGRPLAYAWGLQVGRYGNEEIVEHSGSLGGYRAHIFRVPSRHTSVALLCNTSTANTTTLVRDVAAVVLGNKFTEVTSAGGRTDPGARGEPQPTARPESVLKTYAGSYYSAEVDAVFTISISGGRLELMRETDAAPAPLESLGETFRARGLTLTFEKDSSGHVDRFVVDAGRVRGIVFERRSR
jgi:hypothetical protein